MNTHHVLKEGVPEYIGPILSALESQGRLNETWQRMFSAHLEETTKLWADNAELRDELHAVANRLERLTAFVTTEPAEVAAVIVTEANRSTLRQVRGDEAS